VNRLRRLGPARLVGYALVAVVAVLGGLLATSAWRTAHPRRVAPSATDVRTAAVDFHFEVPEGYSDTPLVDREPLLPARLEATVGQTIRIENHDRHGVAVGMFWVGPGETLTQRFSSPGTYTGSCDVHPSGTFTLVVTG